MTAPHLATNAVILARGLGTRMRREHGAATLSAEQAAVADAGLKSLIAVGRPFLDYLLGALAEAGVRRVCLVIGPEHDALRRHCAALPLERLRIEFAVQAEPRGTADALRAARDFAGGEPLLMVNSDNYYPIGALRALAALDGPGVVGFSPAGLRRGNIAAERVRQFAILESDPAGCLRRIVEKPSAAEFAAAGDDVRVSMNCWRFDRAIFEACERIAPSPRGEWELTDAVQYAIDRLGVRWRVVPWDEPVLDLTSRRDVAAVAAALGDVEVRL